MPFPTDLISPAVARYRRERDRYVKFADRVAEICREDVCQQNAIRAQVTFRVKSEKSFEGKLRRFSVQEDRNYTDIEEIFLSISDLAGVRVSAYQEADCERVVEKLTSVFCGPGDLAQIALNRKDKKAPSNQNYYRAIHVQASLPEDQLIGTYDNVGDLSCEIQICTMISHVWNEVEHDIGYKADLGVPSEDELYALSQLGMVVRQGDILISSLMSAHDRRIAGPADEHDINDPDRPFVDVHDFVSRMRDFAGRTMPNFAAYSGQLYNLLSDIGENSPAKVLKILKDFDPERERLNLENANKTFREAGVEGLILDPETSDLVLVGLIERIPDKIWETLRGRAGRGNGRPSRLHRIAVRYPTAH